MSCLVNDLLAFKKEKGERLIGRGLSCLKPLKGGGNADVKSFLSPETDRKENKSSKFPRVEQELKMFQDCPLPVLFDTYRIPALWKNPWNTDLIGNEQLKALAFVVHHLLGNYVAALHEFVGMALNLVCKTELFNTQFPGH